MPAASDSRSCPPAAVRLLAHAGLLAGALLLLVVPAVHSQTDFDAVYRFYRIGSYGAGLAVGDLDQDGRLDLVCVDHAEPTITIFRGGAGGTLLSPTSVAAGGMPFDASVGDITGDGNLDIVVAGRMPSEVRIFVGNGDGTVQPYRALDVPERAHTVRLVDLNDDGWLDILCTSDLSGVLSVFPGSGGGLFGARVEYPVAGTLSSLDLGDLNEDGRLDVALATPSDSESAVTLLFGAAGGVFGASVRIDAGSGPQDVALADITGDGHLDLVADNGLDGTLSLLSGTGRGSFSPRSVIPISYGVPVAIDVADVDKDGDADVVCSVPTGLSVLVLLRNQGAGTFAPPEVMDAEPGIYPLRLTDLDGDGRIDLLTATNRGALMVHRGNGDGTFGKRAPEVPLSGPAESLVAGDWDGDGDSDLATVNAGTGAVVVAPNHGQSGFGAAREGAGDNVALILAVGDLNEDGRDDLIVRRSNAPALAVKLSDAEGGFSPASGLEIPGAVSDARLVDMDEDGHLDLVADSHPDWGWQTLFVLLRGRGDGGFGDSTPLMDAGLFGRWSVADLNDDTHADLLLVDAAQRLVYRPGDGLGGVGHAVLMGTPHRVQDLLPGDLNGDGHTDLLVSHDFFEFGELAETFLGLGSGAFERGPILAANLPSLLGAYRLADLNNDGNLDLVGSLRDPNCLVEFAGAGDGTFAAPTAWGFRRPGAEIVLADWDADGRIDLAQDVAGVAPDYGLRILYQRDVFDPVVPVVEPLAFTASRTELGVRLRWSLGEGRRTAFRVFRSVDGGARTPATERVFAGQLMYDYLDPVPFGPKLSYWLQEQSASGASTWHGPYSVSGGDATALPEARVVPNPLPGRGRVEYRLPTPVSVTIGIFDAHGRLIRSWPTEFRAAGDYEQAWDGRDDRGSPVAAGLYLARVRLGTQVITRKLNVLK